jgi:hypothetical protein
MISLRGGFRLRGTATVLIALVLLGAGVWRLGPAALAQDAQSQAQPTPPPPIEQVPDPSYRPGFIAALGRWLDVGRNRFGSQWKDAHGKVWELHSKAQDTAKEAVGALVRWPNTRLITGREHCEVAPNGAPDCHTAAAVLCRGKGFEDGRSFDTQSEEKCSSRGVLSGRLPTPSECKTETFVTRAVCQ